MTKKKPVYASPHWARQQTAKEAHALAGKQVEQQGLSNQQLEEWVKDGQAIRAMMETSGWPILEKMADTIMDFGSVLALCDKGDLQNLASAGAKASGVRQLLLAVYQAEEMGRQASASLNERKKAKSQIPSKPRRENPRTRATGRNVR